VLSIDNKTTEEIIRNAEIDKKFGEYYKKLSEKVKNEKTLAGEDRPVVTVGEIVRTLCYETINALPGKVVPEGTAYTLYFGNFNKNAQFEGVENIEDFPIIWKNFDSSIKALMTAGQKSITVAVLFDLLCSYITDMSYWGDVVKTEEASFLVPMPIVHFSNRIVTENSKPKRLIEIFFIDSKSDVALTSKELANSKNMNEIKESIKSQGIPLLKLGSANSFIKNINLTHIVDETMKASLINRMCDNRSSSEREALVLGKSIEVPIITPLQLPLKGEMVVLGHPEWRPFRSFFLSTGIYLIDAVYLVSSITHNLSIDGFRTTVGFIYN